MRWSPRVRIAVALLVALGAVGVGGVLLVPTTRPPGLSGQLLEPPLPAPGVDPALGTSEGPFRLRDLAGRHAVLFFGYTHCPDVCPLTLARVARALELLGEGPASRVQVVMISIDPERDTPEFTDGYARRFHPSFRGASGDPTEVDRVAAAYGIFHGRARGEAGRGDHYLVDHTASLLVLDPEGRVRMILGQDLSAEEIAADLRWLVGT